jgi:cytochrome P450
LLQHLVGTGLQDDLIRDQMLTMLIAGHDTSTALLAWTFALLGQHPDVQARLVEEVDTLEKSPLLDQVIKESLRYIRPFISATGAWQRARVRRRNILPGADVLLHLSDTRDHIWQNESFCPDVAHGKAPPFSYVRWRRTRACIGAAFGQQKRFVMTRL